MERFMVLAEYPNYPPKFESDFNKADNEAYAVALVFGGECLVLDTTDAIPLTIWSRQ